MRHRKLTRRPVIFCLAGSVWVIAACSPSGPAGTASKPLQLHPEKLGSSHYEIAVPESYVIRESEGEDFTVYYFEPSDSTSGSVTGGVYLGNYPGLFEADNDLCEINAFKSPLLHDSTAWTVYACDSDITMQAIAESGSDESWNTLVHAFGVAKSERGLDSLKQIFAAFRKSE